MSSVWDLNSVSRGVRISPLKVFFFPPLRPWEACSTSWHWWQRGIGPWANSTHKTEHFLFSHWEHVLVSAAAGVPEFTLMTNVQVHRALPLCLNFKATWRPLTVFFLASPPPTPPPLASCEASFRPNDLNSLPLMPHNYAPFSMQGFFARTMISWAALGDKAKRQPCSRIPSHWPFPLSFPPRGKVQVSLKI